MHLQFAMITWDDPKRRTNLRKHGIDMFRGRIVFLVWTLRGDDAAHLISCRYADRQETNAYFEAL